MRRRDLLASAGAAVGAALAGCLSSGGSADPGGEASETDTETPTPSPTPTRTPGSAVSDSSFTVADVSSGEGRNEATVTFDDGVTVEGTIAGRNGCYTASLDTVTYADGRLTVRVRSHEREDAGACTQALVDVSYVATFAFEGQGPTAVVVEHDSLGEVQTVAETER